MAEVFLHFKQFAASPIEAAALRVMADLIEKGWTTHSGLYWDDQAVALEVDGEVVAFIVWRENVVGRSAFISLGATMPAHQRRGYYRRLFEGFAQALREKHPHLARIESGYHVDNTASRRMQAALGRPVTWHMTAFDLAAAHG